MQPLTPYERIFSRVKTMIVCPRLVKQNKIVMLTHLEWIIWYQHKLCRLSSTYICSFPWSWSTKRHLSCEVYITYDDAATGETYIIMMNQLCILVTFATYPPYWKPITSKYVEVYNKPKHLTKEESPHMIEFPQNKINIPLLIKE